MMSEHEFFGVQTSSGRAGVGPQRAAPASVAQIEAQVKRTRADMRKTEAELRRGDDYVNDTTR